MDRGTEQNPTWMNSGYTQHSPPNPPPANNYSQHYQQMYSSTSSSGQPSNTSYQFEAQSSSQQQPKNLVVDPRNPPRQFGSPMSQSMENSPNDLSNNSSLTETINGILISAAQQQSSQDDVLHQQLNATRDQSNRVIGSLHQENSRLKAEKVDLKITVQSLNEELIEQAKRFHEKDQKQKLMLDNCTTVIEERNNQISGLDRDKAEMKEEIDNLKAVKQNFIAEYRDITMELQNLKRNQAEDNSASKLKHLAKRNRELEEENERLKLELGAERDNNEKLQESWEQARTMINKYLLEIQKVTSQRNSQTVQIGELQMNVENAKKRFKMEETERQKLEARFIALEAVTAAGKSGKAELDGAFALAGSFKMNMNLPSTSKGSVGESNPAGLKRALFQQSKEKTTHKRGRATGRQELEAFEDSDDTGDYNIDNFFTISDDTDDE